MKSSKEMVWGADEAAFEVGVDHAGGLGAVSPTWMVQARDFLHPAVKWSAGPAAGSRRIRRLRPGSSEAQIGQEGHLVLVVEVGQFG